MKTPILSSLPSEASYLDHVTDFSFRVTSNTTRLVSSASQFIPDTQYTTASEHLALIGECFAETALQLGQGIKKVFWEDANKIAQQTYDSTGNPLLAVNNLAGYFIYTMSIGAVLAVSHTLAQGVLLISKPEANPIEVLKGYAAVAGGFGGAAGMFTGVTGLAAKIPNMTIGLPSVLGEVMATSTVSLPTSGLGAVGITGMGTQSLMSIARPAATETPLKVYPSKRSLYQSMSRSKLVRLGKEKVQGLRELSKGKIQKLGLAPASEKLLLKEISQLRKQQIKMLQQTNNEVAVTESLHQGLEKALHSHLPERFPLRLELPRHRLRGSSFDRELVNFLRGVGKVKLARKLEVEDMLRDQLQGFGL